MVQSWILVQNFAFTYNGVAWCISNLFLYYLIYCFIYKLSFKGNLFLTLSLLLIVFLNELVVLNPNESVVVLYINPYFRFLEFIAGVTLGVYLKEKNQQPSYIYIYPNFCAYINGCIYFVRSLSARIT